MTAFFAAAFMTLTVAALAVEARATLQRRRRAGRRGTGFWTLIDPKWRAIFVQFIVFAFFLGVFMDTVNKVNTVGFATVIGGPIGTQAAAGALAGTALAWGLAHARRLRSLKLANLAEAGAALIIPIVIFLAAAFLADPRPGGGLRSFEIGGLAKVELAAASQLAGGAPQREVQRQILSSSGNPAGPGRRPHLAVLLEYAQPEHPQPKEENAYTKDTETLNFLEKNGNEVTQKAISEAAQKAIEAWKAQRDFLIRLKPFLECVQDYVEASKDRPLIAVTLARPLLQLAMLERSWRTVELGTALDGTPDPRNNLRGHYLKLVDLLYEPTLIMGQYIAAAGTSSSKCNIEYISSYLDEYWRIPYPTRALAPHVAIFAAWSFSAVGSYELAIQTLGEWIDKFRDEHRAHTKLGELTSGYLYWFELRAALEMAAIAYYHEQNASESRLARRVLTEVTKIMDRHSRFPRLSNYGRDREKPCGVEPLGNAERRLLNLRREIVVRLLHAVIDNEDRERELGADDLALAQQLRDLDPACLPITADRSITIARQATSRSTYARVALVWAKKAEDARMMSSEAANELRNESKREARAAMALFNSADAQWRSAHGCTKSPLVERLECDTPFMADFVRARSLWLDIAGAGE